MSNETEKNTEPEKEKTESASQNKKPAKQKKQKYSGAYWYLQQADEDLTRLSFTRALLSIVAFMLQLVALALPQEGVKFVTYNYPSYSYGYMWVVFIMMAVAVYTIVVNFTRNKLIKRIPVERAPKNGFKFFAYIPEEIFVLVLFVLFGMEMSFVCLAFDGVGLVGMFLALISLGIQIWSRTIAVKVLRTAERIPAEEK